MNPELSGPKPEKSMISDDPSHHVQEVLNPNPDAKDVGTSVITDHQTSSTATEWHVVAEDAEFADNSSAEQLSASADETEQRGQKDVQPAAGASSKRQSPYAIKTESCAILTWNSLHAQYGPLHDFYDSDNASYVTQLMDALTHEKSHPFENCEELPYNDSDAGLSPLLGASGSRQAIVILESADTISVNVTNRDHMFQSYCKNYSICNWRLMVANFYCCWSGYLRNESQYTNDCYRFINTAKPSEPFVRVECFVGNETIVTRQVFAISQRSPPPAKEKCFIDINLPAEKTENKTVQQRAPSRAAKPHIVLLSLSGLSRRSFEVYFKRTKDVLLGLDATLMRGYTKVAASPLENMLALLTGKLNKVETEHPANKCWFKADLERDICSTLLDILPSLGYTTAFGESGNSEEMLLVGTSCELADYFFNPLLYLAKVAALNSSRNFSLHEERASLCSSGQYDTRALFNWAFHSLKQAYQVQEADERARALFLSVGETLYGQDEQTQSIAYRMYRLDHLVSQFLLRISREYLAENTYIFIHGDHGPWLRGQGVPNIRKGSVLGRMDDRLPLLVVVPPSEFSQKLVNQGIALRWNSHQLSSPYDIYHSVRAIAQNDWTRVTFPVPTGDEGNGFGLNLFMKNDIPRTCQDAGIPPEYCCCQPFELIDKSNTTDPPWEEIEFGAGVLLSEINKELQNFRGKTCLEFLSPTVLYALKGLPINDSALSKVKKTVFYITFQTKPGDVVFEGTVRYKQPKRWEILGNPVRVGSYWRTSFCVRGSRVESYCLCKEPKKKAP